MKENIIRTNLDRISTPFDSARKPDEKDALFAGKLFSEGIDDLFLSHMKHVIQFENNKGEPARADIRMELTAEDKSKLRILILEHNTDAYSEIPAYENPDQRVILTEIRPDGTEGKLVFYSYNKNKGTVTRRDVSDDWEEEIRLRKLASPIPDYSVLSEEEREDHFQKELAKSGNEVKNLELEIQLGLNELPVTPDEISRLLEFINAATPVHSFDLRRPQEEKTIEEQKRSAQNKPKVVKTMTAALMRFIRKAQ